MNHTTLALTALPEWDLALTPQGDMAILADSAAVSQDVASSAMTYKGEVWFDTPTGIPYFARVLGQVLNRPLLQALYTQQGLTVPDTVAIQPSFNNLTPGRALTGTMLVLDTDGVSLGVSF